MLCPRCQNEYAAIAAGGVCPSCSRAPSRAYLWLASERGSYEASYLLALHYLAERTPRAAAFAADLLSRAAACGCREAALTYARALLDGTFGERDRAGAKALVRPYLLRHRAATWLWLRAGLLTRGVLPKPKPPEGVAEEALRLASEAESALDYSTALALIRIFVERGFAPAAELLGELYESGRMVAPDPAESKRWYLRAFELGASSALLRLGDALAAGRLSGAPAPEAACECYLLAYEAGNTEAALRLGDAAYSGSGLPSSVEDALSYYRAAEKTSEYASKRVSEILAALDERFRRAASLQEEGNLPSAAAEYAALAAMGHAEAANCLGYLLQRGLGVPKDRAAAARLYELGAERGSAVAVYNLAVCYAEGIGRPFSYRKAKELFLKARDMGVPLAASAFAALEVRRRRAALRRAVSVAESLYRKGKTSAAAQILSAAADAGDADAAFRLSCRYRTGDGLPLSEKQADEWENRARALGFSDSKRVRLGYLRARDLLLRGDERSLP